MTNYSTTADNTALSGLTAAATWCALFNAGTEISGGTYARVQTTWGSPSSGSVTGSQVTINVPAGTTITQWALYTASTAGTQYILESLPANETYGSAGTYLLTPTMTASG